jgi:xylan 1,4-beta-xylosidase
MVGAWHWPGGSLALGVSICALATTMMAQDADVHSAAKNRLRPVTYCNPVDLDYRFALDEPSRREAADPTLVVYRGEYWLFASKSGGYWHSTDLHSWKHTEAHGYPVEVYAPTVVEIGGKLYLSAFDDPWIYFSSDPASGQWSKVAALPPNGDPDLFLDDDGRLYMYGGCSDKDPLRVTELAVGHDFRVLAGPKTTVMTDPANHGWQVRGDANENFGDRPWLEGSWMTKHDGKYYLQFSVPATQDRGYCDGVAVADSPMGPFTEAAYNPVSFKPTGFITGAGHSSTFQDHSGAYWHISTMTISVRHIFERRLGLFPAGFTADGQMTVDTYLGDYPHVFSRTGKTTLAGWMLLDYDKQVIASSSLPGHAPEKAVNEDVRSWWSAATGNPGEWLQVDMGSPRSIEAVQTNFADEGSTTLGSSHDAYRYLIEQSSDGSHWETMVDRRNNQRDAPHEYVQLDTPVLARYVRITNLHTPGNAKFSISGFRLFGNGLHQAPGRVTGIKVKRDAEDPRKAAISWKPAQDADFYIVRFGVKPNRLFENYQVYRTTHLDLASLNIGVEYSVTVDAVNDSGIARGETVVSLPLPTQAAEEIPHVEQ